VAVRKARGQAEVEAALEAADAHQLLSLIKEIGSARRSPGDVKKLDWVWRWATKQTRVQLDVGHFNAYITQLGVRKRLKDALELYAGMPKAGANQPTVATFNALVTACDKSEQWPRAVEVFEQMKAVGVQPDVYSFVALIRALGNGAEWERMESAFEQMKAAGVQPSLDTYSILIAAFGKGGHWERMREVFEQMKAGEQQPNIDTFSALVGAYNTGGQFECVRETFEEMKAAGVQPNVITYNAFIGACEKGAQWERAESAFAEMRAARVQPNDYTFNTLISAFAKGAQWERAMELFKEMKAAGVQPDVITYNGLIAVLWQCGKRRTAVDLFMRASEAGLYPPQTQRTLNEIDLHDMSAGAAQVATTLWMQAIATASLERPRELPAKFTVITGRGNHSRVKGESEVKAAMAAFLKKLGSPFRVPRENPGCLVADRDAVVEWLGGLVTPASVTA
jgi:pentatricopeptide repeat domain-containing protein 1